MCRLLAYKGPSVILDDLLYEPDHSLIKQSYHATEMKEPLNGDGFGVGWYAPKLDRTPAVFTCVRPAWNNRNLQYMAPKIASGCLFAHVRAASTGQVTKLNCHPFHHDKFLMMHNGGIQHFKEIRRPLLQKLSDDAFLSIKGQTDSEHIFALFLQHLSTYATSSASSYRDALKAAIDDIVTLKHTYGLHQTSYINIIITDGLQLAGCRYVTGNDNKPLSLHYATGKSYECVNNEYLMKGHADHADSNAVLIVSEKLNHNTQEWKDIPANHFFTVDEKGSITFTAA